MSDYPTLGEAYIISWQLHKPVEVTYPNGENGYTCDVCGNYQFPCEKIKILLIGFQVCQQAING